MPISKHRRRNAHKKGPQPKAAPKFSFTLFELKEEHHEDFKRLAIAAAQQSVADFPAAVEAINKELLNSNPLGILATLAFYCLTTTVNPDEGVGQEGLLNSISQHHLEVLQALVLAIPNAASSSSLFTPDVIQRVVEILPKIADASFRQRMLPEMGRGDTINLTLQSIQERMRLQTQAVRNWGYLSEVVRISTEMFSSLDQCFYHKFGFTASNLICIMKFIVDNFEYRCNKHYSTLRTICRHTTVKKMVDAYYRNDLDSIGSPDEFLSSLPTGITCDNLRRLIIAYFDLRLMDMMIFQPDEIAALTDIDIGAVTSALKEISLAPGSLSGVQIERLFLGNPVWDTPGIDLGDVFFLPIPQMFFSHINRVMERLSEKAALKSKIEERRSEYLESELEALLIKGLPGAKIDRSVKWKIGDDIFETDILAIIDRTVVIAEAKSARLTAEGLRGAPDRIKRHVRDLIVNPSIQSARLEKLIEDARKGDPDAVSIVGKLGIDSRNVDRVIRISVTLDDFGVLSSAEPDFKKIGWIPQDHQLAPTISLADLICIFDILDNPLFLLHYFSQRIHFQALFDLLGDELDFLGLYLETLLNLHRLHEEGLKFSPTGMSQQLDRYYMSRDAGIALPKPKVKLRPLFARTIAKLNDRRSHGWTTAGLYLLSAASPHEQNQIETKLLQLRRMVRKDYSKPGHINSLRVRPPEARNGQVVFYLFPEQLRASSRENMHQLGAQCLDEDDNVNVVVVFARSIDRWQEPYEAVAIVARTNKR